MDSLYVAWQLTALGSSLLAGGGMCYFFYKYPRARVHPGPVLMCILVSLTVTNATRVALLTLEGANEDGRSDGAPPGTLSDIANLELSGSVDSPMRTYIPFFFWCSFFFYTSATLWYLMLALDLIFSLSNPFLPFNADNVKHHVYAWPASLLWCAIFRYVFENAHGEHSVHVLLYYNLPAYTVLLYITGALVLAWRRSRRLETHAHETTRMMAKLILPYLALFAMDVGVTIILYIAEVAMGNQTATSSALDQLALVIEMLGVFVLFCRDAGVFSAMHSSSNSSSSRNSAVNLHLQRTSAFNTQQLQQIQLQTTPTPVTSSGEPSGKIDVPNKLRMDVMKYMSMGIQKSIHEARITEDTCSHSINRPTSATNPSGFRNTEIASDIQFDDYNQVKPFGVLVFGQKNHNSVLSFRDCAPKVFADIRDHFHIDWEFYLESFDPAKILSEHGSEGKSGNIFYFTGTSLAVTLSGPSHPRTNVLPLPATHSQQTVHGQERAEGRV
jgi:1-phosphatidylinositol-4-phosphate 5-kinase